MPSKLQNLPVSFLDFFAFRTPLLPADELVGWAEGLTAALAYESDSATLDAAWKADVQTLRERLAAVLERPEITHALFVASPSLLPGIGYWKRDPDSKKGVQAQRALVRYFERMCTRSTPFGVFSGYSVGRTDWKGKTLLSLKPRDTYRPCSRLDFDYLFALTAQLCRNPAISESLRYQVNSSLHRIAGEVHYIESRMGGGGRSYHLVKLELDAHLDAVMERARAGALIPELADAVLACSDDPDLTQDDALEYVDELIGNQVLVSSLWPPVTGKSPLDDIIEQLELVASGAPYAEKLRWVRSELHDLDERGVGVSPVGYQAITAKIQELNAKVDPAKLYQTDLIKPVECAVLGEAVLEELVHGLEVLTMLGQSGEPDDLKKFREAFSNRYEAASVPLIEALDEELGVGFGAAKTDGSSLLHGLPLGGPGGGDQAVADPQVRLPKSHNLFLKKLLESARNGDKEMALSQADLPEDQSALRRLADSFTLHASLVASSPEALTNGDFKVQLSGGVGPSGARFFGRFCHAEPQLESYVCDQLRLEELHDAEAVYAEIVYLPEGRLGNVLCRPVLREYEIVYLGRSGAPVEKQIPVSDLMVSVRGGRLILRSQRLGRRVIPRLTNAHGFTMQSLPAIYRFLCVLQHEGGIGVPGFGWGPLEALDYLPRLTCGRTVFSVARWRLNSEEIRAVCCKQGSSQFAAMLDLKKKRGLPRWILLKESDNTLAVDLENALSVDAFVPVLKRKTQATLLEMFPSPDELCVSGPEGIFFHELNVPLAKIVQRKDTEERDTRLTLVNISPEFRNHPPGGEWLYFKVYGGTSTLDEILVTHVGRFARAALERCGASQWFFIRYADPQQHLRIRLRGEPERLRDRAMGLIHDAFGPLLAAGRIWKIQFDTYVREVERYGGPDRILAGEEIFFRDSEAVVEMLQGLVGDDGQDLRWRSALLGIDALLDDFGFKAERKLSMLARLRDGFQREFQIGVIAKREMGDRYRKLRRGLEAMFDIGGEPNNSLSFAREILAHRSQAIREPLGRLREISSETEMADLFSSHVHMHINRLMRSSGRRHELVLYEFLHRIHDGKLARSRRMVTKDSRA